MMKRITAAILAALLLASAPVPAYGVQEGPEVSAHAGVVMEADSGRVLWEKQADEGMLIASTTKIMTALVVLEHCDLDAVVTVDPAWTGVEGSSMYLAPGQELTVRDLLYGLMLASGNDAAVALACVTAGSVEAFAGLMNDKAQALGCRHTHFVNANGLDDPEHYASARDLAVITCQALKNEAFRQIVSTSVKEIGESTFVNHNRLLGQCEGVFGVKTGYTMAAGRTLVTACERGGLTLVCVTLSDPDDWDDHEALYAWAYGQYAREDALAGAGWTVPVIGGVTDAAPAAPEGPLWVLHRSGEAVTVSCRLPAFVYAPVHAGQQAGEAVAYVDGQPAGRTALVYTQDVPQAGPAALTLWERVLQMLE